VSPSDRLEELKRQRAQLAEQMTRLDQEAAALTAQVGAKETGQETADPDHVLAQFADAPVNPADVKRGCITAFILALAAVAAALVAVHFAFYR
jgi:predicted nuclease with TOPRIM domain